MQYRRLRSPRDHGGRLIEPPLTEVATILEANRAKLSTQRYDFRGKSFATLSADARRHVVAAATDYTNRYRTTSLHFADTNTPIVMTGHQPELYHAGVWFKNFVLDRIAREQQTPAINLLIDNDTIGQAAIRVPTGTRDQPRVETVEFDRAHVELPFEERKLLDPGIYNSFSSRVRSKLLPSDEVSIIDQLWPSAISVSRTNHNLGQCLSQARHELEADWGLKTLEVPFSHVCDSDSFRWFALTILSRLPHFRQTYNESLLEFRRVNRIRSRTHPVPELVKQDEWLEAPFWMWSTGTPRRSRMFVRTVPDGIEITDRTDKRHRLSIISDGSFEVAVEQWRQLRDRGIKIRSRALLTTMFARLFLCDLFIHGIGGAKYDQLTDAIIQRFFGIDPPEFLVATATAKLSLGPQNSLNSDVRDIDRKLRDLRFNPQRSLISAPEAASLVHAKQQIIANPVSTDQRHKRHLQIAQLNEAMQPMVEQERARLLFERSKLIEQSRIDKVLGSRVFVLFVF